MLRLERVHYAYSLPNKGSLPALRGVSLTIAAGERVALVGANGSGKSTLARHLNGLLLPDQGDVWVDGLNTRDPAHLKTIRSAVGLVFQDPDNQIVATVVEEDVAFGPENLGVPHPQLGQRVAHALDAVQMTTHRQRPPHMLSAGQRQRVAIAGVLAMRPRVLVLDEATAMLDPRGRRDVLAIVNSLHRTGITIVQVTHYMREAALADRVVVLAEGHIIADGPPAEVFAATDSLRYAGLEPPPAVQIALGLRPYAPDLPLALTPAALADALAPRLSGRVVGELGALADPPTSPPSPLLEGEGGQRGEPLPLSTPPSPLLEGEGGQRGESPPLSTPPSPLLEGEGGQRGESPPLSTPPSPLLGGEGGQRGESLPLSTPPSITGTSYATRRADGGAGSPLLIDVSGVQHTYLKATPFESLALRGVDLQVRQGEVLGLVGATGSGKSTLLQHLNGLYRPHTGRVWVVEHDLSDPQVDLRLVRRLVGLLFQNPEDQLFEQFVGDDIAFGPRNLGLDRVAVRERVYEAMRQVGLDFEQFKDRQTFGLSGGQRRRVALAGVLAMKPLVLVLDEPTAGLDPASRTALLQQLRDLNRRHGLTIVISTHSMDDLAELANRIVVLAAGRVALEGPTRAVFAQVDRLVELSLGLPQAAQLAVELRLRGCAVPADLLTVDEAVRALRGLLSPTSSPSSPAVEGGRKRDNERI